MEGVLNVLFLNLERNTVLEVKGKYEILFSNWLGTVEHSVGLIEPAADTDVFVQSAL